MVNRRVKGFNATMISTLEHLINTYAKGNKLTIISVELTYNSKDHEYAAIVIYEPL